MRVSSGRPRTANVSRRRCYARCSRSDAAHTHLFFRRVQTLTSEMHDLQQRVAILEAGRPSPATPPAKGTHHEANPFHLQRMPTLHTASCQTMIENWPRIRVKTGRSDADIMMRMQAIESTSLGQLEPRQGYNSVPPESTRNGALTYTPEHDHSVADWQLRTILASIKARAAESVTPLPGGDGETGSFFSCVVCSIVSALEGGDWLPPLREALSRLWSCLVADTEQRMPYLVAISLMLLHYAHCPLQSRAMLALAIAADHRPAQSAP